MTQVSDVHGQPQDIVNRFAEIFAASSQCNLATSSDCPVDTQFLLFRDVIFSENELQWTIDRLTNKFTTGPDGIHSFVARICSNILSLPLSKIFNLSLSIWIFPRLWKTTKVKPVFKKEDK